ncbi:sensor protein [Natronorubrum sp. JWXQ-INN-674]|uniref:Sensor protein n=1 Tax=Natronorubrum halalkaliphilum TaxID=2691917 RepID=A0A6B0VSD9_9EURY|nr:DICT sensory domain-containing protein [Natronorubrum halalkaliphilum]MXV64043.1 sensor protein [Natronorubrum halalkaliphilum]
MTLSDYIDRIESASRTITVYAPAPRPALVDRLRRETGVRSVDYRSLPEMTAASRAFLVVHEGGEFVAAIGLDAVREFLEPPIYDPWAEELDEVPYRHVIDVFESTVWHTLDRRQLLAASREIENRAWQVGSGTLRVGFQRSGALEAMAPVYDRLAAETALDIHVYIDDDWARPSIPGVTIHADAGAEIGSVWVLVFDGDGDELWSGGLLAKEHDGGGFEGVWVDESRLVALLDRSLQQSV